jgi:hypothetical protein
MHPLTINHKYAHPPSAQSRSNQPNTHQEKHGNIACSTAKKSSAQNLTSTQITESRANQNILPGQNFRTRRPRKFFLTKTKTIL